MSIETKHDIYVDLSDAYEKLALIYREEGLLGPALTCESKANHYAIKAKEEAKRNQV